MLSQHIVKFNDCTTSHLAPNAAQPGMEEELVAVRLKCLQYILSDYGTVLHSYSTKTRSCHELSEICDQNLITLSKLALWLQQVAMTNFWISLFMFSATENSNEMPFHKVNFTGLIYITQIPTTNEEKKL